MESHTDSIYGEARICAKTNLHVHLHGLADDLHHRRCLARAGGAMDDGQVSLAEGKGHSLPLGLVQVLVEEAQPSFVWSQTEKKR